MKASEIKLLNDIIEERDRAHEMLCMIGGVNGDLSKVLSSMTKEEVKIALTHYFNKVLDLNTRTLESNGIDIHA